MPLTAAERERLKKMAYGHKPSTVLDLYARTFEGAPLGEDEFGRCEPTTGIAPFMALVEQDMPQEPYASATRVFRVVDNGSTDTHPPIDKKNPLSPGQPDQPPRDVRS